MLEQMKCPSVRITVYDAESLLTLNSCRQLTPWVALRHDYHPRDFTVYLYKTDRR
jgi:hypothetical protein